MINRVQKILKKFDLSPSQFADEIQIQRSGISHILSGRNKPSLDFVMKTLSAFPQINPDWLILGKGQMLKSEESKIEEKTTNVLTEEKQISAKDEDQAPYYSAGNINSKKSKIDRIVIFYKDKTFEEFNQK